MQVVNGDTLYTWGAVATREILLRSSLFEVNDSIITTQQQLIDSMTVRISTADTMVATLYSRVSDKDGQLNACQQIISIKDEEKEAFYTYIHSLEGEVKRLGKTIKWLKTAIVVLLTLLIIK